MPTAPPVADTKKPATPPPAKDDKNKAGAADAKNQAGNKEPTNTTAGAKPAQPGQAAAQDKGAQQTATAPAAGAQDKNAAQQDTQSQQRFDRMAVRAKMAVSEPGDAAEREADSVADQVSRKFDPSQGGGAQGAAKGADKGATTGANKGAAKGITKGSGPAKPAVDKSEQNAASPAIQRKAATPASSDDAPSAPLDEESQARQDEAAPPPAVTDAQARIKQQLGRGEALGEDLRVRMEQQFGHDLGQVRIHQDGSADQLCRSLGALAFTTGNDIFFASGRYQPASKAGIALLAHELTHVVQQHDSGPAIARKIDPDMPAKYKPKNAAATASALKAMGTLDIPAVKARHLPKYRVMASGGSLKRKRGYERGSPAQVDKWNKGVAVDEAKIRSRLQARGLKNVPSDSSESFKLILGAKKKPQSKSVDQLKTLLKIPNWSRHGKPLGFGFQVDHVVELQVSGENGEGTGNDLSNMELLDQPSNSSSGGAIRGGIYKKVDAYLKTFDKPGPKRRTFLKQHDLVFEGVQANLQSGASAAASSWWSLDEIKDALPVDKVTPAPPTDEEGTDKEFLLADGPGGIVIQRIAHPSGPGSFAITGTAQSALNGLKLKSISLTEKAATGSGAIGSVAATWVLPKAWSTGQTDVTLTLTGDGKHRGYPSKLGKTKLDFEHLSPVEMPEVSIEDGGLFAEGQLTPSLPILKAPIKVTVRGDDIVFSLDYSAGQLAIDAPGVSIDDAMVSVFYSSAQGFGVSGGLDFTVDKVGGGSLAASFSEGKGVEIKGQFDFDSELFDVAKVEAWWRQTGGFGGAGELSITKPNKIKGLKSAKLNATYADNKFTAKGNAETDVPGIKGFEAEAAFVDEENFTVTGKGDFEKLPAIESGSLTLTVTRAGGKWSMSGAGTAVPKLPGGAKAAITAKYDNGVVVITGDVHLVYGTNLLEGDVKATVTNAASVSADGVPSGEAGKDFKVFGKGGISVTIGPLTGEVKVTLQPSGEVLIGGTLKLKDQQLFPEYPPPKEGKGAGPTLKPIVSMPIPGLGFGVGGINVGVVLGAKWGFDAFASIGPGMAKNIRITIGDFNPKDFKPSDIKVTDAGADLEVPATAGVTLAAAIELTLEVPAVRGGARLQANATAEIPKAPPAITGHVNFTWSYDKGLDLKAGVKVNPKAQLKFTLVGTGFAELNLYVKTITLWSRSWPLGEVAYQLPLNFEVGADVAWNSKSGFGTQPGDLFKPPSINMGADDFSRIVDGRPSAQTVVTVDEDTGQMLPEEELVCREPLVTPLPECNPETGDGNVYPRRAENADVESAPRSVDESVVQRLGPGMPLDLAARGYFEQRLKVDLTHVLIHYGPSAAREADKLEAEAFTVGEHIAFADGKYDPHSAEGQELIAHELAHIAQLQGGGAPIVLRWPAVTRTDAHTAETPATIRARDLSGFVALTESQRDWATSPALQGDPPALGTFRDIRTFADGPNIQDACGGLNVGDIVAKGVPAVYPALRKYTDGVSGGTAWLRWTDDTTKAERWGGELTSLEAAWPAANLSLVMRAPDPVSNPSPFERLEDPAPPELPNFISYLSTCHPILSADDGSEVDSFLSLRAEGGTATAYTASVTHVTNYHHFTKNTLEGLARNEAVPQWEQNNWFFSRPMTAVLYPTVDHNGAFHRNRGLEGMVTSGDILTIVLEGHASVADYTAELAPVAARYGENGEIQQVMIGGHGNTNILQLAGSMSGNTIAHDSLGTSGTGGANTTALMAEIVLRTGADPARRRIVLDACLTNSHLVQSPLNPVAATAASEIQTAITANPSLRDFMAGPAGAGAHVFGSNSSFVPAQTTFLTPGTTDIGLSVPGDPDLIADKLTYVEFGTEPEGCMRAMLEVWSADQRAGTHACRDAVRRRIAAGNSGHVLPANRESWREAIIQPLYDLAVNHYWGNGEALRQFGFLAGALFELKWANNTNATTLATRLGALGGNAAHVDRLLGSVAADPRYAGSARIAIVIEQAWMQHRPARRAQFLTALGRYGSCNEAVADVQMGLVMAEVPALLALPPPAPPPADQLRLALLAAHHAPVVIPPPSPLPAHADFLNQLLGAGPNFPPGLGITAALGGLRGGENGILTAIGKPVVGGGAPPGVGPAPAANVNLGRADAPDRNDFRVTPLRRNGLVATVRDNLNVRRRPTTGSSSLGSLAPGSAVFVIGEYGDWYAIEQPNATGFVAKRYVTLLP